MLASAHGMAHDHEDAFRRFLQTVLDDRYAGVASRLAEDIDIDLSTFSRGMKAGTFGLETLLRLAAAVGESPRRVLGLAGKEASADLIERLYGKEAAEPISDVDYRLLQLPLAKKRGVLALLAHEAESPHLERRPATGRRAAR